MMMREMKIGVAGGSSMSGLRQRSRGAWAVLGWVMLWTLLLSPRSAAAGFVFSEIHFDPVEPTLPIEFIEIQNSDAEPKSMGGFRLDGGVQFAVPDGVTVPGGGFSVIARDPVAFEKRFGFRPLGPWQGRLRRGGERLVLRSAAGGIVSEVDFDSGYPWPVASRGAGASMELVHPGLPIAHPASWRSSRPKSAGPALVLVPRESLHWSFRRGTNEASVPSGAWREIVFQEDGTWRRGQTSVGYGDADDRTPLEGMQNVFSSLFLRHRFVVPPGGIPAELLLRVRVDDGCVVWINGKEAGRFHVPAGELAFNALALDHEAGSEFEELLLPDPKTWLREGTNVLAVQAFNATLGSSDFTIDAELLTPGAGGVVGRPSPGATNSVFTTSFPPLLGQVVHAPASPRSGEAVLITVPVSPAVPVEAVTLHYSVVAPGAYLRRTDPGFEQAWTAIAMLDDGRDGDAKAGDGVFSAFVPGSALKHRHLVRYVLRAKSREGVEIRVPYEDDEALNFAFFVYDGVPAWKGAKRPGGAGSDGQVRTFSTNLLNSLPVYHLIAREDDVVRSQYNGGFNGVRFGGTLVYDGVVYDHVEFHNRGEASTYVSGKNKWRVHFNRTRRLAARDAWGRPYRERWDVLNLNGCSSPWAAVHRGMSGLDEGISFRVYQLLGLPSSHTHLVHFRVVDSAIEAALNDQYTGDFWGLYLAVEQPDGSFLDERGLPDGNLYKLEGGPDKKHQGATHPLDSSDWTAFSARSGSTQPASWWRTNLDLKAYYSFQAGNRVVGNVDLREGWNHYFFHSTNGLWTPVPWDLDMQFIPKTHWSGSIAQKACLNTPELRVEYGNRAREILDLFLSDAAVDGGQIGQLIDEWASFVRPEGLGETWPEVDQAMWNYHPRTPGDGSAGGQTNHRGNFFRSPFADSRIGGSWTRRLSTPDFEGFLNYLKEYCTDTFGAGSWAANNGQPKGYGYRFLASEAADASIPQRPAIAYAGSPGFPIHDLRFEVSAFVDPQGASTFRGVQWRIAEIGSPGVAGFLKGTPRKYEIEPVWESPELRTPEQRVQIAADALRPGRTYRVRARYWDASGRASSWSLPFQFMAGAPDLESWRRDLRVTEIHYHPLESSGAEFRAGFSSSDFEFVELANLGSRPLPMGAVRLAGGVRYQFPDSFELAPAARTLVVGNREAFVLRNGSAWPVAGVFEGNLANDADTIRVEYGEGTLVVEVRYQDAMPWPVDADGRGPSLEWIGNAGQIQGEVSLWRASASPGGSPGRADRLTYAGWSQGRPALADPDADPDLDGHVNWVEFASGGNPLLRDEGFRLRVLEGLPGTAGAGLGAKFDAQTEGVVVELEDSMDLVHWKVLMEVKWNPSAKLGPGWLETSLPVSTRAGEARWIRGRLRRVF